MATREIGNEGALVEKAEPPDVLVISKFLYQTSATPNSPAADDMIVQWTGLADQFKSQGAKIVLDCCENPFIDNLPPGSTLANAARFLEVVRSLVDVVVTNSEMMANHLRPRFAAPIRVIPDPVEGLAGMPKFLNRRPVRMVWFGHVTNYDYLKPWINELWSYSQRSSMQLTLVTSPDSIAQDVLNENTIKQLNAQTQPKLMFKLRPWSLEGVRENLEHADLVFIPSDPSNPRKNGASSNRLATALWLGRFPIASPVDSYREFGDYCWVGSNLVEGIDWALTHPDEVLERLQAAIPVIESRLSVQAVGDCWLRLFSDLRSAPASDQNGANPTLGVSC